MLQMGVALQGIYKKKNNKKQANKPVKHERLENTHISKPGFLPLRTIDSWGE